LDLLNNLMKLKKVFIIILNFNGKRDTLDCLKTIQKLQISNYKLQIIVVDNASTDGSLESIKSKYSYQFVSPPRKISKKEKASGGPIRKNSHTPTIKLIKNRVNLGFAEGNNVGIRYSLENGADYCLILNNDTLVDKNTLLQLISRINAGSSSGRKADERIGIISPKIYFAPGFEFHRHRYKKNERGKVIWFAGGRIDWKNVLASHRGVDEIDIGRYQKTEETDFATGCCMLIKKEVFEKIGLFDQKYFLYWEDIDLCMRAKETGFKIFYAPEAFLWHKNASSSEGAGGRTAVYYQERNRLLFALKFAPLKSKIAVLKQGLGYLFSGTKLQRKAVKDFLCLRFGKIK